MSSLPPVLQILLALLTLTAGIADLRTRRIPNALVGAGLAGGLALNGFLYGSSGLVQSAKGMGLAMLVYLPLFALRAMGGGDTKLMAAVGATVGPANWLGIFLITALLGGVVAVVVVLLSKRLGGTLRNITFILGELVRFRRPHLTRQELQAGHEKAISLPHGAIIACACLAFLAATAVGLPR